uniref:START domain-containing protein n=1 Tax=Panagrellus redivivus TaxID=6233 RepID=A0A7E4V5E3_PANRE
MLSGKEALRVASLTAKSEMWVEADSEGNAEVINEPRTKPAFAVSNTDALLALASFIPMLKFKIEPDGEANSTPQPAANISNDSSLCGTGIQPRLKEIWCEEEVIAKLTAVSCIECYGDTIVDLLRWRDIIWPNLKSMGLYNKGHNTFEVIDVFVHLDRFPSLKRLNAVGAAVPNEPDEIELLPAVSGVSISVIYHVGKLYPLTQNKQNMMKAIDKWINVIPHMEG